MTAAVRSRLLTVGGGMLAAAGLAATMAVGTAAIADEHTADTLANVEVANVISLTGDAAFTLAGAPGDEVTQTSALTAESNDEAGYNVTVLADDAELEGTGTNTDTIAVSAIEVDDSDGTPTALDTETAVTVYTQSSASAEGGDALTASYSLTVPFVNADTYSGGLTFTATAN